jgi:hypothetical protein
VNSDPTAAPTPSTPLWKRVAPAAAVLLLLIAGGAAYLLYFAKPAKLDVWARATVPYSAGCAGGCETLRAIGLAHGGGPEQATAATAPRLVYNPRINDPIAQWGDCLQSIMTCVRSQPRGQKTGIDTCVAQSSCPAACKERYASGAGADFSTAEASLFGVFVDEDAVCRPEDAG